MDGRIKTVLLLGLLTALMLVVGGLIGGRAGLTIALIFAVILNFGTYWFSDRIILFMYRAKRADRAKYSKLYKLVKEVAKEADMRTPKVYIVKTDTPNAFATGRSPRNSVVAVTTGILHLLNDEELKGVIAHEISHIKNYDMLIQAVAATIAGVISYLAMMARYAAIFGGFRDDREGGNIVELLVLAILAPIIAIIIQLAISRSREYLADASAAKTLKNGEGLARALLKLEAGIKKNPMRFGNATTSSIFIANPFSARGLLTLFSTHPPIEERVKRLRSLGF
jgi:heat shock protein HtpX